MREIRSCQSLQRQARAWGRAGTRVALVPTMGFLHAGHLDLVSRARRAVGPDGIVVLSIFVNPLQFSPREDLARYPRDLARDRRLCRAAGVDVLFVPRADALYGRPGQGARAFSTFVVETRLSARMEGEARPTHFRGVTTVVTKLFHLAQPGVAVFGAKDFQQTAVVRRMVRDLNLPVRIIVAPTRREPDGLALSSRNAYLNADQRRQAVVLSQAIRQCRQLVRQRPQRARRLQRLVTSWVAEKPAARLDYVEFFHPETLEPVKRVRPGTHMALAVHLGRTRLIDNGRL